MVWDAVSQAWHKWCDKASHLGTLYLETLVSGTKTLAPKSMQVGLGEL